MTSGFDKDRIPWANDLRRVDSGLPEWMAPMAVVRAARRDYLRALSWMQERRLYPQQQQAKGARYYMSGAYLKRYQAVLQREQATSDPYFVDVLRADHQVAIRHFSSDGGKCLAIDRQSQRRMATYDYYDQRRLQTQDLGECTLVYQLAYSLQDERWKLNTFIQRLPEGWDSASMRDYLSWMLDSMPFVGRDS